MGLTVPDKNQANKRLHRWLSGSDLGIEWRLTPPACFLLLLVYTLSPDWLRLSIFCIKLYRSLRLKPQRPIQWQVMENSHL